MCTGKVYCYRRQQKPNKYTPLFCIDVSLGLVKMFENTNKKYQCECALMFSIVNKNKGGRHGVLDVIYAALTSLSRS